MEVLLIIFLICWCIFLIFAAKALLSLKTLNDFKLNNNTPQRTLSVVIAVKNEEEEIENTLLTLLDESSLVNEVIVVNDRSTDQTKDIIERVAQTSPRLKNITINELPNGWLGKVNALNEGTKLATGDYILYTDGDVEISNNIIQKSLNICETNNLDHLTIFPKIPCPTLWLKILVLTSKTLFTLSARPWLQLGKKPLNCIVGIGPFNLVKRSFLEKTEGFEWLKMDVADDVALSRLIVKNGGRSLYIQATDEGPIFPWYRDAVHMMHGLEKNIVGGFTNYRIDLLVLISFVSLSVFLNPILSILAGFSFFISFNLFFWSVTFAFACIVGDKTERNTFLLFPLGIFLLGLILIRSAFICYKNGGIVWSNTFYPLKQLREGTRVKLGL